MMITRVLPITMYRSLWVSFRVWWGTNCRKLQLFLSKNYALSILTTYYQPSTLQLYWTSSRRVYPSTHSL